MTEPTRPSPEPRTEAGRALLAAPFSTEDTPPIELTGYDADDLRAAILAIEAEAAAQAQAGPSLDVDRLARAIKSRYGLKQSVAEIAIYLRVIVEVAAEYARLAVAPEPDE